MEIDIVKIGRIGESLIDESRDLTDIIKFSEIEDPELVFLFPATNDVDEEFEQSLKDLDSELECPLLGVSIGGFATPEDDSINTHGAAAIFFKDLEFEIESVEDPWQGDKEKIKEKISDRGTTLTFEPGAFGPSQTEDHIWSKITNHSSDVLSHDLLGEREALLKIMRKEMKKHSIGYSNLFEVRFDQILTGEDILNFSSGDLGDFKEGYEIKNNKITPAESAYILNLEKSLKSGSLGDSSLAFENGRVLETFEDIEYSGRYLFKFDGKSIPELEEKHPIQKDIGRGNFMYYLIIEEKEASYSMPINADLDIIVSPRSLEDVEKVHLARAPSFSEYINQYSEDIQEIEGTAHISINPPQFDSYRSSIDQLIEETKENLESFIITTDNAISKGKHNDFNFPKYMVYDS